MSIFVEVSIILCLVAVVVVLLEKFRLPPILGYIGIGLLIGPQALHLLQSPEILESLSHFGVIILLFIVGIHLSPEVIKDLGIRVLLIGCLQILFSVVVGAIVFSLLDFTVFQSALLGLLFAFSSTILVLKLFGDAHELETLHGRVAIGILIIQDVVVSIALIFLGSNGGSGEQLLQLNMLQQGLSLIGLVAILFGLNRLVLPRILPVIARNQEVLFIAALAWGVGIASAFYLVGFSLEIGALLAGVLLSTSEFAEEISSRLKPLRDFFVMLFFVTLGTAIAPQSVLQLLVPSLLLIVFVSVIKPLIIMFLMQQFGYHRRSSYRTGVSLGQLSEFSFILAALWLSNGWLNEAAVTLTTVVGVATIGLSTLAIPNFSWLEKYILPLLPAFKQRGTSATKRSIKYSALLIGFNHVGEQLYTSLKKRDFTPLVIDFDPKQVEELQTKRIRHRYGDAADLEFLQSLPAKTLKLVVSTIPSLETNLIVCKHFANEPRPMALLFFASSTHDAEKLYDAGASFVVIPHAQAAQTLSTLLERFGHDHRKYARAAARG